jgi:hypothetical protein
MTLPSSGLPNLTGGNKGNFQRADDAADAGERMGHVIIDIDVAAGGTIDLDLATQEAMGSVFRLTGAPAADFTLRFTGKPRRAEIWNVSNKVATIDVVGGATTTHKVAHNARKKFIVSAVTGFELTLDGSAGGAPHNIVVWRSGKPGASERVLRFYFAEAATLPPGLADSQAFLEVATTAAKSFDLRKGTGTGASSSIGSIDFASSARTSTYTFATAQAFAAGDYLDIIAPASQDTTLAGLSATLLATRD